MDSLEKYFCQLVFEMNKFRNHIFTSEQEKDFALTDLLALPKKMLEEMDRHGITSEEFWECSCEKNFHHNISENTCQICGDILDDSPDALMSGVVEKYIQENGKVN